MRYWRWTRSDWLAPLPALHERPAHVRRRFAARGTRVDDPKGEHLLPGLVVVVVILRWLEAMTRGRASSADLVKRRAGQGTWEGKSREVSPVDIDL